MFHCSTVERDREVEEVQVKEWYLWLSTLHRRGEVASELAVSAPPWYLLVDPCLSPSPAAAREHGFSWTSPHASNRRTRRRELGSSEERAKENKYHAQPCYLPAYITYYQINNIRLTWFEQTRDELQLLVLDTWRIEENHP
jgi:hypothetical protein